MSFLRLKVVLEMMQRDVDARNERYRKGIYMMKECMDGYGFRQSVIGGASMGKQLKT